MMKRLVIVGAILLGLVAPAAAQFATQATYGVGAGTANAQTVTIPNASSYADLLGVPLQIVPGATNTTAATLTVSGNSGALSGGAIAIRRPTSSGLAALVGGEIQSGQSLMVMYDGTFFVILSVTNTSVSVGAANLTNSSLAFNAPVNLQINATVSANALTIALKGNNGSDPSATNPVLMAFRDVTIANGGPVIVSLQAALSFTIASSSTMGCVSAQMCRLWVVAINNGGTAALCAFNALSSTNIAPINEAGLQTSASGTSGGNSAQTYYCSTSAVSAKAIRIIGYIEVQEATAGTWATGPTYVQLFGPGIMKPGQVIQSVSNTPTSGGTTSSASFAALSGGPTQAISLTSAANVVRVRVNGTIGNTQGGADMSLQLARGASLIGQPNRTLASTSGQGYVPIPLETFDVPNTTSSTTYGIQGKTSSGTITFPAAGSGSPVIVEEIMASLRPANDNEPPALQMAG